MPGPLAGRAFPANACGIPILSEPVAPGRAADVQRQAICLFQAAGGDVQALFGVLALLVLFSAPFYMMFVFAPRQITES